MIHLSEHSCLSFGNAFCGSRQKIKLSKDDIKRLHDFLREHQQLQCFMLNGFHFTTSIAKRVLSMCIFFFHNK